MENSKANLFYTDIRSPYDGVVIDRKIDEGQSLARNSRPRSYSWWRRKWKSGCTYLLRWTEADIGLIRQAKEKNNPVLFTVDAYPDDLFQGKIHQVRMNPTTVQNVVTYTVVVEAANPELKLLPGMTAKLSFQIDKHKGVIKVPNAALRFYPKPEYVLPEDREAPGGLRRRIEDRRGDGEPGVAAFGHGAGRGP